MAPENTQKKPHQSSSNIIVDSKTVYISKTEYELKNLINYKENERNYI